MSRPLVLMFAVGQSAGKIAAITAPLWERTARRWGADFRCKTDRQLSRDGTPGTLEKLRCGTALAQRPRVLLVDADTVPHLGAPSLFDLVPPTHLGALKEWPDNLPECWAGHHGTFEAEYKRIQAAQGWPATGLGSRFNSGVLLASAAHAPLFTPWEHAIPAGDIANGHCLEESWLNLQVAGSGVPVHDIGLRWNCMRHYRGEYDRMVRDRSAWVYHVAAAHVGDRLGELRTLAERLYPSVAQCRHRSDLPVQYAGGCCGDTQERIAGAHEYDCERFDAHCCTGLPLSDLTVRRCRACPEWASAG